MSATPQPKPPNPGTPFNPDANRLHDSALALLGAIFVARACWPGEGFDEASTAQGLAWVLVALGALAVGSVAALTRDRATFRWGWVDTAALVTVSLVALSAGHAADRRVAINLAWHWVGVGTFYFALRLLADSPARRQIVNRILVATAFALACYGLYQVVVLFPEARRMYLKNPALARQLAGVGDDPAARMSFEFRLLGSREPISTFSLANSLAGFLLPPLVLVVGSALASLAARRWRSIPATLALLAPLIVCFLLTKSRTGYIGLLVGLLVLALLRRGMLRARTWLLVAALGAASLFGLVVAGLATRQLDRFILSEAAKSLQYRWEYWIGTFGLLREGNTWWAGLGPGNFGGPYLRHKLAVASEGIKDPHNAFLEVWATGGLPALAAFIAALILGARALLGAPRVETHAVPAVDAHPHRWPLWFAGIGGLLLAMLLRPELSPFANSANPFEGDFDRWGVLLAAWTASAWIAGLIRLPDSILPQLAIAAGAAMVVNLLGAGGIGFAPVACMFAAVGAIGLNARDTLVGTSRTLGRTSAIAIVCVLVALAGTFWGTVTPGWKARGLIEKAERSQQAARLAMQKSTPEDRALALRLYDNAAALLRDATRADRFSSSPWLGWALLELEGWRAKGAPSEELIWHKIKSQLRMARTPPRDPNAFPIASAEFQIANQLLGDARWIRAERITLLQDRLEAAREAARLNPTGAGVHADAAYAAEALADFPQAIAAAERALELDALTPHRDRKLPKGERERLETRLESWRAEASNSNR